MTTTTSDIETRLAALEAEVATLRDKLEYAETLAAAKRGLEEADRGMGVPARQLAEQIRARQNLPSA